MKRPPAAHGQPWHGGERKQRAPFSKILTFLNNPRDARPGQCSSTTLRFKPENARVPIQKILSSYSSWRGAEPGPRKTGFTADLAARGRSSRLSNRASAVEKMLTKRNS
jgi:hypothetical protein